MSAARRKTPTGSSSPPGAAITYRVDAPIAAWRIYAFAESPQTQNSAFPARPTTASFEPLGVRAEGVLLGPGRLRLPGPRALPGQQSQGGDPTRLRIELPAGREGVQSRYRSPASRSTSAGRSQRPLESRLTAALQLVVDLKVPLEGVEPPLTCVNMDLNHARLPIPPQRPVVRLVMMSNRGRRPQAGLRGDASWKAPGRQWITSETSASRLPTSACPQKNRRGRLSCRGGCRVSTSNRFNTVS